MNTNIILLFESLTLFKIGFLYQNLYFITLHLQRTQILECMLVHYLRILLVSRFSHN